MKALYIKGSSILTSAQRSEYSGHRIENADAFDGVARGIDEAEVVGDYPAIEKALKDAGVEFISSKGDEKAKAKAEPAKKD